MHPSGIETGKRQDRGGPRRHCPAGSSDPAGRLDLPGGW